MCGRQLPAVQQAPAQTQYQQPYQQPSYPAAGPAPIQPQYQQQYQQPQYQQQPYQQAQYQQPAAQMQAGQPMMQQPGKPKKNMMLIAILAIVAVVIVVVAIVLLMGLGGSGSSLTIVNKDTTNVNAYYWALNGGVVNVDVTVKNNAAVTTSGTIHVKIVSTMPVLGTKYTSEGSEAITLAAGAQQTFTVDVTIGVTAGAMLVYSTETTVTIS
jgi:hypothetical protein